MVAGLALRLGKSSGECHWRTRRLIITQVRFRAGEAAPVAVSEEVPKSLTWFTNVDHYEVHLYLQGECSPFFHIRSHLVTSSWYPIGINSLASLDGFTLDSKL